MTTDNSSHVSEPIPNLYQSEGVPLKEKIIHQRYQIKSIGFYWLVAELDPKENLAFAYANLNDDQMSEWGYIDISELISNGAVLDLNWMPCTFSQAMKKVAEEQLALSQ